MEVQVVTETAGEEDRFCCHYLMFIEAYDVPASIYRYYKCLLQVL